MRGQPEGYWIRFENVDGRIVEDLTFVPRLPEVGQLIPVSGTHCEVMEQWVDRTMLEGGGPGGAGLHGQAAGVEGTRERAPQRRRDTEEE